MKSGIAGGVYMYEVAQEKIQGEKESIATITGGKQNECDSVDPSRPSYNGKVGAKYHSE